jgi:hypothetical protein
MRTMALLRRANERDESLMTLANPRLLLLNASRKPSLVNADGTPEPLDVREVFAVEPKRHVAEVVGGAGHRNRSIAR